MYSPFEDPGRPPLFRPQAGYPISSFPAAGSERSFPPYAQPAGLRSEPPTAAHAFAPGYGRVEYHPSGAWSSPSYPPQPTLEISSRQLPYAHLTPTLPLPLPLPPQQQQQQQQQHHHHHHHHLPAAPAPESNPSSNVVWPHSLKGYIARCFSSPFYSKTSSPERTWLESYLKEIIQDKILDSTLNTADWDNAAVPLPFSARSPGWPASSTPLARPYHSPSPSPAFPCHGSSSPPAPFHAESPGTQQIHPSRLGQLNPADSTTFPQSAHKPSPFSSTSGWAAETSHKSRKRTRPAAAAAAPVAEAAAAPTAADMSGFVHSTPNPKKSQGLRGRAAADELKQRRMQRFQNSHPEQRNADAPDVVEGASEGPIKGTSTALEKSYLRLTAHVDPTTVRSLPVLEQSFQHVLHRYAGENDYSYLCDQLKSIRQDLLLQRISNEFAVGVYETHARIALSHADIAEFTQCLSQLRILYEEHGLGTDANRYEFMSYRFLFYLGSNSILDLTVDLQHLPAHLRDLPPISHALAICRAWTSNNYHRFFQLYRETPNQGKALIDSFISPFRSSVLIALMRAYKTLPIEFAQDCLGFSEKLDFLDFLQQEKVQLDSTQTMIQK